MTRRSYVFLIPPLLFALCAGVLIATQKIPHRVAYDQLLYHQATIDIFASQWPNPDLTDYLSATTPLYHLGLAFLKHTFSLSTTWLQLFSLFITFLLLSLLSLVCFSHATPTSRSLGNTLSALALPLPFAASLYIFASGTWLLPDNLAWLGVTLALLLSLHIARSQTTTLFQLAFFGLLLFLLVLVRQIHLWTAGLIIASAWLSAGPTNRFQQGTFSRTGLVGATTSLFFDGLSRKVLAGLSALFICLPAILIMIYFYGVWGGLTPPTFQFQYHFANLAGPAFLLAVFGFVSLFFAGYILPKALETLRLFPTAFMLAFALFLPLSLVPRTTAGSPEDYFAGRRTGLWDVAAKFPDLLNHTSPFMLALSLIGALALASIVGRWHGRPAIIIVLAFLGYGMALAAGGELWQRYAEPFALIIMILVLGLDHAMLKVPSQLAKPSPASLLTKFVSLTSRVAPLGALALTLLFVLLNIRDLRKPGTQLVTDPPPPAETSNDGTPPRKDSPYSRYWMMPRPNIDPALHPANVRNR